MTSTGLPTHQQMDKKEQKCIPPHSSSYRLPQWMYQIHSCRRPLGLQQHLNKKGGQRKSCIPHSQRAI